MTVRLLLKLWLPLCLFASQVQADGWRENIWHFVCPNSPFYAKDRQDRYSAGMLTSEGSFALMVLGDADQGALVSINVPGDTIQSIVTSTLEMPAGNILSRTVSGDQLWAAQTPDQASVTYTFRVDPADIEFFQGGRRWKVRAGNSVSTVSLTGSRLAINAALAARDTKPDTTP